MKQINAIVPKILFNQPLMTNVEDWTSIMHDLMTSENKGYGAIKLLIERNELDLATIRDYCVNPLEYQLLETWRLIYDKVEIRQIVIDKLPLHEEFSIDGGLYVMNAEIERLGDNYRLTYRINPHLSRITPDEDERSLYLVPKEAIIDEAMLDKLINKNFSKIQTNVYSKEINLASVRRQVLSHIFVWDIDGEGKISI